MLLGRRCSLSRGVITYSVVFQRLLPLPHAPHSVLVPQEEIEADDGREA